MNENSTVKIAESETVKTLPASRMVLRIFLKRVFLHGLAFAGYLLGLPLWHRLSGKYRRPRILLYHSVNEDKIGDINVRTSEFKRQMDFLARHYAVLSLEKSVLLLKDGGLPEKPTVAITFDDGYSNNYHVAFPILQERNLEAAIFLLSNQEREVTHLKNLSSQESELMDWDEVRQISKKGIALGAHGESHRPLKNLSLEELNREIFVTKEKIESEIKTPVLFFSYPYGTYEDFSQRTEALVKEAGYDAAFSAVYGTNNKQSDLFALKRIGIEASDSLFTFRAKLNGALDLLEFFGHPAVKRLVRWMNRVFFHDAPSTKREEPLLLVSVDFPPHTDGVSTISRELSVQLSAQGKNVFVIGPKDHGDKQFDAQFDYRCFRVPGYEWGYLRFFPILFTMPYVVFRYGIRKVFAMNIAYGGIISWALSFLKPLEYLIFAYGYEFEKVKSNPFAHGLYLKIYARAKSIICCSEQVRQRLIQFGVDPEKIFTLYPAVDLKRYYPCELPAGFLEENNLAGRKILLTVGRLVERKGHDQVLKALPKVIERFPDVVYCIVGAGEDEQNLHRLVAELKLEPYVRFMGRLPEKELLFLYNACELFIMASREIADNGHVEGFGIVYLEANACRKAVIAGKTGGVVEAVRDGESGLMVDPYSVEDITEKIIFLLSHPEKNKSYAETGFKWVRENFNWEQYVKNSYEFLCGKDCL